MFFSRAGKVTGDCAVKVKGLNDMRPKGVLNLIFKETGN